jgi:hypothetical protein
VDNPISIAGQILSLRDRGWAAKEIALELKIPAARVNATIRQASSRSMDSRRLFEVQEMCLEILAILREIRGMDPSKVSARMRTIEKRDLPMKLGAAIDRLTGSELPGNGP